MIRLNEVVLPSVIFNLVKHLAEQNYFQCYLSLVSDPYVCCPDSRVKSKKSDTEKYQLEKGENKKELPTLPSSKLECQLSYETK